MSWGLLVFIAILVITNMLVGYVIAVLWGMGPKNPRDSLILLSESKGLKLFAQELRKIAAAFYCFLLSIYRRIVLSYKRMTNCSCLQKNVDDDLEHVETTEEKIQRISDIAVTELLEDQAEEITRIVPVVELFDDNLMSIVLKQNTEAWLAADKRIETSILKLNHMMMQSGQYAGEIDQHLREMKETLTQDAIVKICQELKDDCNNYMTQQSKIAEDFFQQMEEHGELKPILEEMEYANLEQTAQIESTLQNLENIITSDENESVKDRLITELGNLRRVRHRTRDLQDRAFIAMMRYENRLNSVNRQQNETDAATGLYNRIALELNLAEWYQQKRHQKSKLIFALYDIAGFNNINNIIGIKNSDRLVQALAAIIENRFENKDFIGLFKGNCLVSVASNNGIRKTVSLVERIRQEVEKTTFVYNGGKTEISMQLSCAVTEWQHSQTDTELLTALTETMNASKKSGQHLMFQIDSTRLSPTPELVDAPATNVDGQIFDVDKMKFLEFAV